MSNDEVDSNAMTTFLRDRESEEKMAKQIAFRKHFADNLCSALDRCGSIPSNYGRGSAVAELFRVSQNTAASWLKGEGVPELSRLPELAAVLGTTVEQLVMGEGECCSKIVHERYVSFDMHKEDNIRGIPWFALPDNLHAIGLPNNIKMLQVTGDDMSPFIKGGDVVVYDPSVRQLLVNGVFVLFANHRFIVRRVQTSVKRDIRLICDNPRFDDEILKEKDLSEYGLDEGNSAAGCLVAGRVIGRLLVGK